MCMTRNINKGHCMVCGCVVMAGEGFRREVRGRGYRVFCDRHASNLEMYHASSRYRADSIGTPKKMPLTRQLVGVEIEIDTSRTDAIYLRFRGTLERVGYCLESDCTVRGGEAPSPKMQGLAHISKVLQNNEDIFYAFTENTGAHIHTACSKVEYLRRYYHSIFVPFSEYLERHNEAWLIEKFGSGFRHYAQAIDRYSDALDHSNVVNLQHSNTIEFRLPRIRERHQFMDDLKFWREVGFLIENFDFKPNADKETRKASAKTCGDLIVRLAIKYFGA